MRYHTIVTRYLQGNGCGGTLFPKIFLAQVGSPGYLNARAGALTGAPPLGVTVLPYRNAAAPSPAGAVYRWCQSNTSTISMTYASHNIHYGMCSWYVPLPPPLACLLSPAGVAKHPGT